MTRREPTRDESGGARSGERETPSRRAQRVQEKVAAARRRRVLVAGAVAALVAVSAVVLAVRATGDDDATDEPKSDALLLLADYSISGTLAVGAGDVTFAVANNGNTAHNVGIRGGPITANLAPGRGGLLQIQDLQPGTYELYCDIADHEERGMTTILVVVDVAASSSVTSVG